MANVDEIKKKKMLDSARLYDDNMAMLGLGPKPAQPVTQAPAPKSKTTQPKKVVKTAVTEVKQPSEPELADDSFDFDMPELEQPQIEPTREPASKGYDLGGFEDVAALGASPLLAFLTGASPAVFNMHMDKANKGAAVIGDEAKITKDKISVIEDENGNPLNVRVEDSVGKKPFYQKKSAGGGLNGPRSFMPITLKNVKTGEITGALQTSEGYFDPTSRVPYDMSEWLPFKQDDLIRSRTVEGGYKTDTRNKYTNKLNGLQYTPGIGDRLGGVSKEEATSAVQMSEKARTETLKTVEAIANAKSSLSILEKPNLSAEEAAAGIHGIVRALNGERMSDNDYAQLQGDQFKGLVRQVDEFVAGRLSGYPPAAAIQAFRKVARHVIAQKEKQMGNIKSQLVPNNLLPRQGQQIIDQSAGKFNQQETNNWKSQFKGMGR